MAHQPRHQSVSGLREETVVEISWSEMRANWLCAASLADKEQMHGTADRLRYDVHVLDGHFERTDVLEIRRKR